MKRMLIILSCLMLLGFSTQVFAGKGGKFSGCTTIQDGVLTYSADHYLEGEPIPTGFDKYGYNYQGHMFSGSYFNAYAGRAGAAFPPYEGDDDSYLAENPAAASHWAWPYRNDTLMMKWSDEWLSNKDCNGDGNLDRGYSCDPANAKFSDCPGAWLTNHQRGSYEMDGKKCNWTYFVKIITPDEEAGDYQDSGIWYTADDTEIGPSIWGGFAIIQEVVNDKCAGLHGVQYLSPAGPGLGKYNP